MIRTRGQVVSETDLQRAPEGESGAVTFESVPPIESTLFPREDGTNKMRRQIAAK